MIEGNFLNAQTGVSKKGNQWFRIQTVVMSADSMVRPYDAFVEQAVYEKVKDLRPKQNIILKCGVNSFGNLCVEDVIVKQEVKQ